MKSININDVVMVVGRPRAIGKVVASQERRYLVKWKEGQATKCQWLKRKQLEQL